MLLKLTIDAEIPFRSYKTEKDNKIAVTQIKREIKRALKKVSFIELSVEENYDDCTGKSKFKIKSTKLTP